MTRDQFKKELNKKGHKWKEEGEWIIVSEEQGHVYLGSLKSIPDNVQFRNSGNVNLDSLKSMGNNVQFRNSGFVNLTSLESMGNNVQFRNSGSVYLISLKSIPDNIQFNNSNYVILDSLKSIPINIDTEEMFPKCEDIRINDKWLDLEGDIPFPDSRWESVDTGKVQMYESWVKNNY